MQSSEEIAPRPLPTWLSIPIILLCLGGGGWIIHWYVMTDSLAEESHVLGDAAVAQQQAGHGGNPGFGRGPGFNGGPQGGGNGAWVRELRNGGLQIRGKGATAVAVISDGRQALQRLYYNDYKTEFPADDVKTIAATRLLVEGQDKEKNTAMKVTPDQIQKLRNLSQMPDAALTQPQRDEILNAFVAYHSAAVTAKQDAANKLRQIVDQVATEAKPTTKAEIVDRAKKINEIVTPEQWKIDADMGGGK